MVQKTTDCLVIGSGAAGMWFALRAAAFCRVTLITKTVAQESNSRYAQGGIAAVWNEDDSFENHVSERYLDVVTPLVLKISTRALNLSRPNPL